MFTKRSCDSKVGNQNQRRELRYQLRGDKPYYLVWMERYAFRGSDRARNVCATARSPNKCAQIDRTQNEGREPVHGREAEGRARDAPSIHRIEQAGARISSHGVSAPPVVFS